MERILYVPLDERTCNYDLPRQLAGLTDCMELLTPEEGWMGFRKQPADREKIWEWIEENAGDCAYAILSVDTLVYGNIIGSRIHERSREECLETLERFVRLKRDHPKLKIHAFNLVARAAAYNGAMEDPDYWADYGYDIWRYMYLTDRMRRGLSPEEERQELDELKARIPENILADFLRRRETDRAVNLRCVELTRDGVFDVLTVPKDDTAEFGASAMDQLALSRKVRECRVMDRVLVYPGADEAGCVQTARIFCLMKGYVPRVYPRFSSVLGPTIVPRYEDRPLMENVKSQIFSCGGICVENAEMSDCLLALNSPGAHMIEAAYQEEKDISFSSHINMHDFLRYLLWYRKTYGKCVGLAEVSVCNGCEREFMEYALISGALKEVSAVGGWNTSANTIGVVLATTVIASWYGDFENLPEKREQLETMRIHSLVADWLFQAGVLREVLTDVEGKYDPYDLGEHKADALAFIQPRLEKAVEETLGEFAAPKRIRLTFDGFHWDMVQMLRFSVQKEE